MPDEVNYIVNDALGLAQFLCQNLNENQAVVYLQAIDGLSKDNWKEAKTFLDTVDKTARHTKEGNIRDIVQVFKNTDITDRFVVANLSLVPGFQTACLELYSYVQSSVQALQTVLSSRSTSHTLHTQQQTTPPALASLQTSNAQAGHASAISTPHFPSLPSLQGVTASDILRNSPPASSSGKQKNVGKTLGGKKSNTVWTNGTSVPKVAEHVNKAPQLKFICIAVKSGPDETADSLKAEIEEWKTCKELKVEEVSQTAYSTMFRVQYTIPAQLSNCWTNPAIWPARMSASQWRGNPKSPLMPLPRRQYNKKIYIGNLPQNTTEEIIERNLKTIYKEEIEAQQIQSVEVYLNAEGLERAKRIKAQNPGHVIHQSACVVLTSHPGVQLRDITLKQDQYEDYNIRKTVRFWRGREPQKKVGAPLKLTW